MLRRVLFLSSGRKIVNKTYFLSIFKVQTAFTPISRHDEHAKLFKIFFKPLVKKLKISTLAGKSNFRLKVTKNGRKIIHHKPVHVGKGNLTLRDAAILVPGINSDPSGEICLSYVDTYDGLL